MLLFPFARIVFRVSQHVADVNLVSIIMHGGDQSNFVAPDVEDGELAYLVGVRERIAQPRKILEPTFPNDPIPMGQR
jgi:hypothetical protein